MLNGYVRDTRAILNRTSRCFALDPTVRTAGPRHKVYDFRIPVEIGGVRVNPGDISLAISTGCWSCPADAETEVFTRALEKARGEKVVRKRTGIRNEAWLL